MKKILLSLAAAALTFSVSAQNVITIKDSDLNGGSTYNWTNNNTYLLDGFVFLESGGTLNIQAGTVIKGKTKSNITTADPATALIICRGAKINAEGSQTQPIIFTTELDDVNDPGDMLETDIGLWGGVVLLGNASVRENGQTEARIEGIASTEARAAYGGTNDNDNSGTLKYVSIRHTGNELVPGNELNGLTFGGVGSGTTIDFVEVFACSDDGFEWFGGTVNARHMVSAFNDDDGFDWDIGYRGKGQFWFTIQTATGGDCAMELDGAIPDGETLWSKPTVYNMTLIGQGKNAAKSTVAILLRDNTGGILANSIITDFPDKGIEVEDLEASKGADSRKRMEDGDLELPNNIFWDISSAAALSSIVRVTANAEDATAAFLTTHLTTNNSTYVNPGINHISRIAEEMLDPRVSAGGTVYSSLAAYPAGDAFFKAVDFKGAFSANGVWLKGWSALDQNGYLKTDIPADFESTSIRGAQVTSYGVQVYPNPAKGMTVLSVELEKAEMLTVELYDMTGKLVKTLVSDRFTAGSSQVNLNIEGIQAGIYICKVTGENNSDAQRLIIK